MLQGGGALGAYEHGAITALLELIDEAIGKGRSVMLKAVSHHHRAASCAGKR